jgi:hypothetical protein
MGHNIEIALSAVDAGIDNIDQYVGNRALTISRLSGAEIGCDALDTPRNLLRFGLYPTVWFDISHPRMSLEEINLLVGQMGSKPPQGSAIDMISLKFKSLCEGLDGS